MDKHVDEIYKINHLHRAFSEKSDIVFQRYCRVRDRLPHLLIWVDERCMIENKEKIDNIRIIVRNIDNWIEWIFTGKCEAFSILPEGLISVQPTGLDDEAVENYGGKGYSLEGKNGAAELWMEACAMADAIDNEYRGFKVTESLSKD